MPSLDEKSLSLTLGNEAEMMAFGRRLIARLPPRLLVSLSGELGAGKSVLARSIIEALGYTGRIKSPSYALLETYQVANRRIAHLDLYRLNDPEELHYLGFDDVLAEHDLILIEWPEKAAEQVASVAKSMPHWQISIDYADSGRVVHLLGLDSGLAD